MSRIVSIGTALPQYRHDQMEILSFMQHVYAFNDVEKRKLSFLYHLSGIDYRYSVIPDYSRPAKEWKFYPLTENFEPFPSLEQRMQFFNRYAASLSVNAIRNCLDGKFKTNSITHLITVSCTGLSAPGLDLQVLELLDLPKTTIRTSVNFMGCYAAIHALKIADTICKADPEAKVMIVCTELCTLHFQREPSTDNITSSLLFGDGSAAVLITGDDDEPGINISSFYAEVLQKGKKDMAWELSSTGFQMTLSSYIPDLIETDFNEFVIRSLMKENLNKRDISYWCIHPGGKKILEASIKSLDLPENSLAESYSVLKNHGNMSSATILFVLKKIMNKISLKKPAQKETIFAAAFGPGLTMETFIATKS